MSNDSGNYDQALSVWNLSEEKESAEEEGCGVFSIFNVKTNIYLFIIYRGIENHP